jgi:hypothetical protein
MSSEDIQITTQQHTWRRDSFSRMDKRDTWKVSEVPSGNSKTDNVHDRRIRYRPPKNTNDKNCIKLMIIIIYVCFGLKSEFLVWQKDVT